jgi:type III restriction enzyme
LERFRPRGSTDEVSFRTGRECRQTLKSHISHVVLDTPTWEASVGFQLETSPLVQSYVRNDHLELAIPYDYRGQQHRYYPDFLVRLVNGTHLLLEVKGYEDDQDRAKAEAAKRWRDAVNAWSQMGRWAFDTCRRKEQVPALLQRYAAL